MRSMSGLIVPILALCFIIHPGVRASAHETNTTPSQENERTSPELLTGKEINQLAMLENNGDLDSMSGGEAKDAATVLLVVLGLLLLIGLIAAASSSSESSSD